VVLCWPTRTAEQTRAKLRLIVLFTTPTLTRAALAHATTLSRDLHAEITLLAAWEVPYPLPLAEPTVSPEFLARQLLDLVPGTPLRLELHFCRDAHGALNQRLPPGALLLINPGPWYHRKFHKLAAALSRDGFSVIRTRPKL
jgi:hypothetical protein